MRRRPIPFTSLALIVASLAGCDHFYGTAGVVTDCDTGDPIDQARVELELVVDDELDSDTTFTNVEGRFTVVVNAPYSDHPSDLRVEKAGYLPASARVVDIDVTQRVCLEAE